MPININQNMYNVTKQPYRNLKIRINILNYKFQVVDEISGNVIGGNLSIDANSDVRRTCNVSLVVTDSSFEVQAGSKIYLDKYIQIFTGIDVITTGMTEWINHGIYLIDQPSYQYSADNHTLSFSGLDLMSKLTGLRNGYLPGVPTIIPQGSSVRDAMIMAVTQLGGFTNYLISECYNGDIVQTVPYDIKIEQGGTVYQLLDELRNIIPNYEIFFDVNGTFIYQQIPSDASAPILVDDDIWNDVLVAEQINTDFTKVKNVIEVYGASLDPAHYSDATVSGSNYVVSYAGVSTLTDKLLYGFTAPSIITNPSLQVNSLTPYPIKNADGTSAVIPEANTYYIVLWDATNNWFEFIGHQQTYAIAKDENPNSPFYVGGPIGEIRIPLYGGEYDKIQTDSLAKQRAKWEIYQRCRFNDTVNFSCVPVYWLDVNILVSHAPKSSTTTQTYMVKSVSTDLSESGTQSVELMIFYPFYNLF